MALVSNKYCNQCDSHCTFIEGYDDLNRYVRDCTNCAKIRRDKENRKILREGILKRTRRKAKTTKQLER